MEFLYQSEITKGNYINMPEEVHDIISSPQTGDKVNYHWNYYEDLGVMISGHGTRERNASWKGTTRWSPTHERVTVPEDVRNIMEVDIGDCLYFLTHSDMEQANLPSVYVWDLDKIDRALTSDRAEDPSIFERLPNFQ